MLLTLGKQRDHQAGEAKLEGTSGGANELWNATGILAVHEAPERPRCVPLSKVAWPQTQSPGAELILRGLDLSLDSDIKKTTGKECKLDLRPIIWGTGDGQAELSPKRPES